MMFIGYMWSLQKETSYQYDRSAQSKNYVELDTLWNVEKDKLLRYTTEDPTKMYLLKMQGVLN